MASMTNKEAHEASFIAAQIWAEDFADLLTVFDGEKVNRALFSRFSTTHRADDVISYEDLCEAFIDLFDRKVLVPVFSMVGIPASQLLEMRAIVAKAKRAEAAPAVVAPTPAESQARANDARARDIDQCASDWKSMDSKSFRAKWNGARKPIFEAAVAEGRI